MIMMVMCGKYTLLSLVNFYKSVFLHNKNNRNDAIK
jgi:hypothetical protein